MAKVSSTTPTITAQDLKDPALSRINQIVSFLWTKLSALYSPAPVVLTSDLTVASLSVPSQTNVPSDTTQAATVATVQALLAQQAKPLVGMGATLTFPGFTMVVNGAPVTFTKMVFQNGLLVQVLP